MNSILIVKKVLLGSLAMGVGSLWAQDALKTSSSFGDRTSVAGQLDEDAALRDPGQRLPWLDGVFGGWSLEKKRLNDQYGLQLGFDYNSLFQTSSESLTGEDLAWGGAARLYARWAVFNHGKRNTGFLVGKIENRHSIDGRIPPKQLGGQFGYVGVTDVVFSNDGPLLTELSYQQRLGRNDQAAIVLGRFDPNSYMDVLGYSNPWTSFSNLNILLNTSIALPDFSWGIGAGTWFGKNEQWYVSGTINDANGNIRDNDWFKGGAEFFKQIELGWAPDRERRLYSKASITYWHVDDREDAGVPSAEGVVVSANKTWDDTWMAFGRAGVSSGGAPLYNASVVLGAGRTFHSSGDQGGIAFHWGDPSDSSLDDEWASEIYYRFQLSKNLQFTPSLQYILNPARNQEDSGVAVFGMRLRAVF